MVDYILTSLLLLGLLFSVVYKAKAHPDGNQYFFDKMNTNAMRGFWCIIVILVHVPAAYQNKIQDMAGSFAYIGVTFFFLTSAFGLTTGLKNNPNGKYCFWRRRFPALLIPSFLANLFVAGMLLLLTGEKKSIGSIFHINSWVMWLMFCYVVFWLSHILCDNSNICEFIQDAVIILTSLVLYFLRNGEIIDISFWPTEIWGFIWGSLLARHLTKFVAFTRQQWLKKCILTCIAALFLGILYLKFKTIVFWGEYLLKIGLGIAITLFILQLNIRFSISNKYAAFLGSISFEIYLIHDAVMSVIGTLFPQAPSGIFIIVSVVTSIVTAYIIHKCVVILIAQVYKIRWFQVKGTNPAE